MVRKRLYRTLRLAAQSSENSRSCTTILLRPTVSFRTVCVVPTREGRALTRRSGKRPHIPLDSKSAQISRNHRRHDYDIAIAIVIDAGIPPRVAARRWKRARRAGEVLDRY